MWLFSHHTQPFNVAFQPPHSTLECGFSATTHNHLMWLFSHHTQPVSVAVQPPLMHFFSFFFSFIQLFGSLSWSVQKTGCSASCCTMPLS
jgi:hypothetical protein